MRKTHVHLSDIHGYSRLAVEATLGVTDLVEAMHHTILRVPRPLGESAALSPGGMHGLVYRVLQKTSAQVYRLVRQIATGVGGGFDAALEHLQPELAHLQSSRERAAVIAILNGVLGDHMTTHGNPLTITMGFRHQGQALELTPQALTAAFQHTGGKLMVLLHGHCMNEMQWCRNGHDHGAVLAQANGYTPVYLRYNSGLHVSQNGRALADQLDALMRAWPRPVEDLLIIGYSMGGLLARSALHYAQQAHHGWPRCVKKVLFVGTPHHGSMLEQAGNLLDVALEVSPYSAALARLGKIRSAGTTDLRHGNVLDEDWAGRDRFARGRDPRHPLPLPQGVQCYAIAAMLARQHGALQARLVGDGLVPLQSALGQHPDARRALGFAPERQKVFYGLGHLGLLDSMAVRAQMQDWIAA